MRLPDGCLDTAEFGRNDHRGDESLLLKVSNVNSQPTQSLHDHVSQADKKLKKTEPNWATQLADFLAQNKASILFAASD